MKAVEPLFEDEEIYSQLILSPLNFNRWKQLKSKKVEVSWVIILMSLYYGKT